MAIYKCKMCGGSLDVNGESSVATCEYCGSVQTLPKKNDEVIANLFNRANNLRIKCEFDKAAEVYEKILNEDNNDSEAHWGLVLCKYGIEYVEDPKTYKRIPTCHRTQYESILTDVDYLSAVSNADSVSADIYKAQAEEIANLQKDILAIVKNEKPFDVFICYKETDENGKRTVDSALANDIYYQLTQEGLKVFYAAITLEDKLGVEYEPYIFAALNSAKVMLVVGTKPEYFEAIWVKNEWSRYLKLTKDDRSKLLIPCYRDMDAYDLPEEFSHLQAQDMGKIGFVNDVVRGIKKVVTSVETKTESVVKETVIASSNANTAPLLKRVFMFLEDGDWQSADEYCEKVLDIDPECAEAYLGKLMAEVNIKKRILLDTAELPFDNSLNYQKAVRFGESAFKDELEAYVNIIKVRNEENRLKNVYNKGINAMNSAVSESDYKIAADIFKTISDYKDSLSFYGKCIEKADEARKDQILQAGINKMNYKIPQYYEDATKLFELIPGWKDADELLAECEKTLAEIKAKEEAERLEQERKDELARIKAKKRKDNIKKGIKIVSLIVTVFIVFIIILNTVVVPKIKLDNAIDLLKAKDYEAAYTLLDEIGESDIIKSSKYDRAIELMEAEDYDAAISVFNQISDFKDVESKIDDCYIGKYGEEKWNKIKNLKVGDTYTFGKYEQDNNAENGKEEIQWVILEKEADRFFAISKYALVCQPYNMSYTSVSWETCYLRNWLNSDFINEAFTTEEKAMIPTVTLSADVNPDYSTDPGNATQDKVFLLSINEANKYFSSDNARKCKPTEYAEKQGVVINDDNGNCWWWLRTPGYIQLYAADVNTYGSVYEFGYDVINDYGAVRPALWIAF